MTIYTTGPSSRERDLVDLVVLATTQRVDASDLRKAIGAEARRRNLADFSTMTIPAGWGSDYAKLAKNIPACADYLNVSKARVLMSQFIDRILSDYALSGAWDPGLRIWNAQFSNGR